MEHESSGEDFLVAMMKRNHTTLSAGAAIAAVLAMTSTASQAQTAPTATTTAPTATTAAPVPTFPEATPPTPLPAPASATPTMVVPIEVPEIAPPAATVPDPAPVTADLAAEPLAVEATMAEPGEAAPAPAGDANTQLWAAVLVGIVAIALGIWGFIAIGRRKPVVHRKAAAERPAGAPPRQTVPERVAVAPTVTPMASARPTAPAPSLAHTGAAVALPSRRPATFAERDALLKRMVAAKPDRANPFTSPKARLKRARLILQSLGRDFGDREPRIDFSQYPSNWPEAASRKHAAA